MAVQSVDFLTPELQTEQLGIQRRQKLADALISQGMQPAKGVQAGRFYMGPSPLQSLANVLSTYAGVKSQERGDEETKALVTKSSQGLADVLTRGQNALAGTPAQPPATPMDDDGNAMPGVAETPGNRMAAANIFMQHPQTAGIGAKLMTSSLAEPKWEKVEFPLPDGGKRVGYVNVSAPNPISTFIQGGTQGAKYEFQNTGGEIVPVNPYQPPQTPITKTATPDTVMTHTTPSAGAILTDERTRSEGEKNRGVQVRGQDKVNDRARDANEVASGQKLNEQLTSVRKEFNALPEVQNYRAVVPVVESARKAPNTAAGDLDLIYAVGKSLDPNSVVREGELALVIKSGSPMERFKGMVNYVQGGGRLAVDQRKKLTDMLDNRAGELRKAYESAKSTYEKDAQRRGLPNDQVFMNLGDVAGISPQNAADPLGIRK